MFITGPIDKEAVGKMGAVAAISSQKPPAASQGTAVATLPSSILGAQETSKVIIIPPGPSGQAISTSSRSLAGQQTTTPAVDRSVAAERVMTIPAATVASIQQEGSAKSVVLPSALIPGLKDFNQQSKAPMRFLMVTTAKNQAGQPVKSVKTLVLQNPQGVSLDGQVVLKIQEGQPQPGQIKQYGQPVKGQDGSAAGPVLQTSAAKRPLAASEVVEIIDDDDDIVMLSSTPASSVSKKTTVLRATARAPSAVPGQVQGGSPGGKARQGVQLIHGGDYDAHMMEGEEMMFGDDDAT